MKTLKFRHEFVKEILEGRKMKTWRLFDDKDLKNSDELELVDRDSGKSFARALITDIQIRKIKDLTDNEFKNHGYNSRDEMIISHKGYYGDKVNLDSIVKMVKFKLIF